MTVVVEAAGPSLKQQLLDSRALEHQPEWAAQHGRYSSLREETVLEILTGVAEGLRHLADRGVSAGGSGGGDLTNVLCSDPALGALQPHHPDELPHLRQDLGLRHERVEPRRGAGGHDQVRRGAGAARCRCSDHQVVAARDHDEPGRGGAGRRLVPRLRHLGGRHPGRHALPRRARAGRDDARDAGTARPAPGRRLGHAVPADAVLLDAGP